MQCIEQKSTLFTYISYPQITQHVAWLPDLVSRTSQYSSRRKQSSSLNTIPRTEERQDINDVVLQSCKWGEATFGNESSKITPLLWSGKPAQEMLQTQFHVIGPMLINGIHPHSDPPSPVMHDLLETRPVMLTTEVVS